MVGRRFKTWIACILSACMMLMSVPQAMAAGSAPLSESEGVELLRSYGIVRGDETGNLHLDKQITRAEMSAIAVRAMGMDDMAQLMSGSSPFTDMKGYEWANGYVTLANQLGLVKGRGNGIFDPGASITYAEAYTIFLRMVQREPAGAWNPTTIVNTARSLGIAPSVAGAATANMPAIRGSVFGSLANAIYYVTLPGGKTILQTYVDPLPPTIVLDNVPSTTVQDSVVISGSAGDAVSVTVNGQSVPITSGGRFSTTVNLTQGANKITVVAVDRAGNSDTKTVDITYSFNVSRIDVKGTSQLKIGESTTITATAYTSDNRKVPDDMITASVSGGIGTYDKTTGKFTAGNKAGKGSIVFKAGDKTETFDITVIDPANEAAALRIRFAKDNQTYLIEDEKAVILVEVLDKSGNVVKYDSGRTITLEADDKDLKIEKTEVATIEGVAMFRVEAKDAGEYELEASTKGLRSVTMPVYVVDDEHIVLIPEKTVAPADGKSKVAIRAYLRDEDGDRMDNEDDVDIVLIPSIDAKYAELQDEDEDVVIEPDEYRSDRFYVVAGKKAETVIVTVEIDSDHDYDIVPAVIYFGDGSSSSDDTEDDEAAKDQDEYEGYFEITKVSPSSPTYGDTVSIKVKVYDMDEDLIDDDDIVFQVKAWIDNKTVDDDFLDDFDGDFLLTIADPDDPDLMIVKGLDSAVKARTVDGVATVYLTYTPEDETKSSSKVKIEIVGASLNRQKDEEAVDDAGELDTGDSGRDFKSVTKTITFKKP